MFKRSFLILFVALLLVKCSNKLDILAPYKESVAVYGLLNQNDTAQYIRIHRVFLGEGNALLIAQNPDSIYYKPNQIKVTLQRIKAGTQVSVDSPYTSAMEIVLTEEYLQTQAGVFSSNQLLYKTKHKLYDDSQYRLVVHSNKSGKDFTSTNVGLIGDFKSGLVYGGGTDQSVLAPNPPSTFPTPQVNIVPSNKGIVVCKFNSPANSSVCGLSLRFYYTESTGGTGVSKYTDIGLGYNYILAAQGGQEIDLSFSGDGMMNNIADAIKVDPNINHRTADSVYFVINAGGFDISLYNQVNGTTSLSQDKPNYSNISGGVGVFSSRKDFYLLKKLTNNSANSCLYRLANDPITCHLHFYYNGAPGTSICP